VKFLQRILLILVTILVLAGCDQTIKKIAQNELKDSRPVSYMSGLVTFQYAENSGVMLSIGSKLSEEVRFILFVVITSIVLFLFLFYIAFSKDDSKFRLFAYALVLSGGFGNLIDRINNNGRVIDYIVLGANNIHTAIFNLADVLVISGMFLLIFTHLIKRKIREI